MVIVSNHTITLYRAREVVSLDPSTADATGIAVHEGRIFSVGVFEELIDELSGSSVTVDERFSEAVIVPGFIEAHGHLLHNGLFNHHLWLGFDDRQRSDGSLDPGCRTIEDVLARLSEAAAQTPRGEHVFGAGFDPVFVGGRVLTRQDLDSVSTEHFVSVMNASMHWGYANSTLLEAQGITADTEVLGVEKDANGEPTGAFAETALPLIFSAVSSMRQDPATSVRTGAQLAKLAGVTTHSDMAVITKGKSFDTYRALGLSGELPVRVVYSPHVHEMSKSFAPSELLAHVNDLQRESTDRFAVGPLKWISDGSIQGFTAALAWPGYCSGHDDHGILLLDEDDIVHGLRPFHEAGHQAAIHANGDAAIDVALRAIERLLTLSPRPDHRHRLEHCQMISSAQLRKAAALGVAINFFSNHLYYWGDIHRTSTMGPAKARRMDPAASAEAFGVTYSLHSDAPVTPVGPLFTMWCAVNRVTRSGITLGDAEKLTPLEALRAVTLGSAQLLHRDHELGSLEVGKAADFTVLAENPLTVEPYGIKDIAVLGTVLAGTPT